MKRTTYGAINFKGELYDTSEKALRYIFENKEYAGSIKHVKEEIDFDKCTDAELSFAINLVIQEFQRSVMVKKTVKEESSND